MDIMEKEVFVGAKREKRGQRFVVKKRHVCSSQKFKSKRFLSRSLTFSHFFSLSLSPPSSLFFYSSHQREHDVQWKLTPSTSASIHALLASSHRRRNNNGRRRRRNFDRDEDDEDDDRVSRARRRGKRRLATFSLSFELENALSLFLSLALSSER